MNHTTPVPLAHTGASRPPRRRGIVRTFFDWQMRLSERFDRLLPARYRIDGNTEYMQELLPAALSPGAVVYDVGGGKTPAITADARLRLRLRVIGVDIDAAELARAPEGSYDGIRVADISRHNGDGDGDLVICQGVLEHIRDAGAAFRGLASLLRPGGTALIFVPNRNALFSRLNMILPEGLKRRLLFWIFPGKRTGSGFPAYYDRCTPRGFRALAEAGGFEVTDLRTYYRSRYFSFFLPLYVAWRCYLLTAERLFGHQAAETFSMVLRRSGEAAAGVPAGAAAPAPGQQGPGMG